MTFTFLNVALPVGLGAMFGAYRYINRLKAKAPKAFSSSVADALKATAVLVIITLGYKLIFPS